MIAKSIVSLLLFSITPVFGGCLDLLKVKPFDPFISVAYDNSFRVIAHHPDDKGLPLLTPMAPFIGRWFGINQMAKLYKEVLKDTREISIFEKIRDVLRLEVILQNQENLAKIPKEGPLVIVANHPLAGVETIAIAAELQKVRPDISIFLNSMLENIPILQNEHFIFVNVYNTPRTDRSKRESIRKTSRLLSEGKALIIHPSGAVSDLNNPEGVLKDSVWQNGAIKFARKYKATVLTINAQGSLSNFFLNVRKWSVNSSVALLISEILKKSGSKVTLTLGDPIPYSAYEKMDDDEATEMLRKTTYGLVRE